MRLNLIAHPDFSSSKVHEISADIEFSETGNLTLCYTVIGHVDSIALLEKSPPKHTDYLWQHTCFEAFIRSSSGPSYYEFNFSPSSEWAVYGFESHRKGMENARLSSDPVLVDRIDVEFYQLKIDADLSVLSNLIGQEPLYVGLSTIIEEKNGHKSLWALKHPDGNPDFHDQNCFIHTLQAADII